MATNRRPVDPSWIPQPPPPKEVLPAPNDPALVEKAITKARRALKIASKGHDDIADLPFFLINEFGGAQRFAKEVRKQYKNKTNGAQFRRAILEGIIRACHAHAERNPQSTESEMSDDDLDTRLVVEAADIPPRALVDPDDEVNGNEMPPEVTDADETAPSAE